MKVNELVKHYRERQALSQQGLGELLGLTGSRICELENGKRHLRFLEAVALAGACALTDDEWAELRAVSQ